MTEVWLHEIPGPFRLGARGSDHKRMITKRILFVTGTRADFGKLKPLIQELKRSSEFSYTIFATGMAHVFPVRVHAERDSAGRLRECLPVHQSGRIGELADGISCWRTRFRGWATYIAREVPPPISS